MTLGENIKKLRKNKRMTQKELGEFLGIQERMVQKYEFNTSDIQFSKLKKLSELFEVPIEVLISEKENTIEPKSNKLILSDEIKECLRLSTNDFKVNFRTSSYVQTKELSESILALERALSYQLQIEEKYKIESEDK